MANAMRQQFIEALEREGIKTTHGSRGLVRSITCTACGKTAEKVMSDRTPPSMVVKAFKNQGWVPGNKPKCRPCATTRADRTQQQEKLHLNLEEPKMTETKTEETTAPARPYKAGHRVDLKSSTVRARAGSDQTELGIGLPHDIGWTHATVKLGDNGHIHIIETDYSGSGSYMLPSLAKKQQPRRWMHFDWAMLGHPDPMFVMTASDMVGTVYEHENGQQYILARLPENMRRIMREARDKERKRRERQQETEQAAPNAGDSGEPQVLQDVRDANAMLREVIEKARADGYDIRVHPNEDGYPRITRRVERWEDL